MVHDDEAEAPYGWSHCLTMLQASLPAAVAATARRGSDLRAGLCRRRLAAGAGLTAPGGRPALTPVASRRPRTNARTTTTPTVKYTLACLHASTTIRPGHDPPHGSDVPRRLVAPPP
jgi:hypothetical protein